MTFSTLESCIYNNYPQASYVAIMTNLYNVTESPMKQSFLRKAMLQFSLTSVQGLLLLSKFGTAWFSSQNELMTCTLHEAMLVFTCKGETSIITPRNNSRI